MHFDNTFINSAQNIYKWHSRNPGILDLCEKRGIFADTEMTNIQHIDKAYKAIAASCEAAIALYNLL